MTMSMQRIYEFFGQPATDEETELLETQVEQALAARAQTEAAADWRLYGGWKSICTTAAAGQPLFG
jgi:hypothetical protein